jgi:hypothetical protein
MAVKIVVEVNGGVVQEIYSDDPVVTVVVVDWDTEGSVPDRNTHVVLDELDNEFLAHAVVFEVTPMEMLPLETRAATEAAQKASA